MNKILIALDYDPTAQKVAEKGYALAKSMKADVILLHVSREAIYYSSLQTNPIMGFEGFDNKDFTQYVTNEGLDKASHYFLEKIKNHLHDESITIMVEKGDFADAIISSARKLHADLIVMGSHSKRWLEQILIGSVTEKVLRQTTCPLFIVPTKKQKQK
jgi:nucleotide-binding universal stress UspA family protein